MNISFVARMPNFCGVYPATVGFSGYDLHLFRPTFLREIQGFYWGENVAS